MYKETAKKPYGKRDKLWNTDFCPPSGRTAGKSPVTQLIKVKVKVKVKINSRLSHKTGSFIINIIIKKSAKKELLL